MGAGEVPGSHFPIAAQQQDPGNRVLISTVVSLTCSLGSRLFSYKRLPSLTALMTLISAYKALRRFATDVNSVRLLSAMRAAYAGNSFLQRYPRGGIVSSNSVVG